jgi:hypothetical protein
MMHACLVLLGGLEAVAGWMSVGACPAARVRPAHPPSCRPAAVAMDARARRRRPENVEGEVFVDETCINCDTCRSASRWDASATRVPTTPWAAGPCNSPPRPASPRFAPPHFSLPMLVSSLSPRVLVGGCVSLQVDGAVDVLVRRRRFSSTRTASNARRALPCAAGGSGMPNGQHTHGKTQPVCVCVCVCVQIYTCVCVCVHSYIYTCVCMCVCARVRACVLISVCACVCTFST